MKTSAGLLMYRTRNGVVEVFLVHPGGPFWAHKDHHAWDIPKGEVSPGQTDLLEEAKREFTEETGLTPAGPFEPLGSSKFLPSKVAHIWAFKGDWDGTPITSNTFTMEWPPFSGREQAFPEVDKAVWVPLAEAREKAFKGLAFFFDKLSLLLEE
jgi:predicted NUDIX family NTP pyrophosphohydrolase